MKFSNVTQRPITEFGQAVLEDRYFLKGEDYDSMIRRVASYYGDDKQHSQRLYEYISNLWFMPSTPILSNGGTERGLPISCFLNETSDSLEGIVSLWDENVWLSARGGGIGSYWGNLRSIGQPVRDSGKTSGIIPFISVQNAITLAVSQGSLRRGSAAVYLSVNHPEIFEFLEIRKPTGGDPSRKSLNLHHAVVVSDSFMNAVEENADWDLVDPKNSEIIETVSARDLWIKILTLRLETGEPYIMFSDATNNNVPALYKTLGHKVKTSNLCSEIMLTTGPDFFGRSRTAVCCLSSVNLKYYDEWEDQDDFIFDVMRFLDNVLQDFINKAPSQFERAKYSAMRERSVGLGVMGFHSILQKRSIPFESAVAKALNIEIFQHIKKKADSASKDIAKKKGSCPDAEYCGVTERFTNKIAIAPTASISIIAGEASPGIEPYVANVFNHKTLSGSFVVRNEFLVKTLEKKGKNSEEVWSSILSKGGSVQHLDFLDENEKLVFKTAAEIDQLWVIEHAADRTPYVCQSQSLNIFIPPDIYKKDLHNIHVTAWKKGIKSLYYCRSLSIQRAHNVSNSLDKDCLSCQ